MSFRHSHKHTLTQSRTEHVSLEELHITGGARTHNKTITFFSARCALVRSFRLRILILLLFRFAYVAITFAHFMFYLLLFFATFFVALNLFSGFVVALLSI